MRILLTGASGRIGQATARLCAGLGADLVLADRLPVAGLLEALRVDGGEHVFLACDIGSRREIDRLCDAVGDIDAAVLNAEVSPGSDRNDEAWDDDFEFAMDVNVRAPARLALALIPRMKARGRGRLVLIGSDTTHIGGSRTSSPLQDAGSKSALDTMVRSLARSAAPQVLVNGLALGRTAVSMLADIDESAPGTMPVPRLARPEEIAWPVAFLCSPGASFVCGAVLDVSGRACIP